MAARAVRTREVRAAAWFERYAWFVSSENCLVLSARDGQQADLLLKRHMRCEVLLTLYRALLLVIERWSTTVSCTGL